MLTTSEAARLLGVERVTVNQYIRRGQLHAEKHGRDLFITEAEIERFKQERPKLGWPKGKPRKENTEMSYNAGITARIQSTDWDYLRSYTDEQIAAILNRLGGSQQERAEYTAAIAVAASRQIDSLITNRKAKAMITVTRQSWIDNDDDDALA